MTGNVAVDRTLVLAAGVLMAALVTAVVMMLAQPRPVRSVVIQTSYGATVISTQVVPLER